jgi:hypothetical protein
VPRKCPNAPLARIFDGRAGGWLLLLSGACMLAFGAAELPALARMGARGADILDFEFAASTHRVNQILIRWGPLGRSSAREHGFLDVGFIVGYGLLIVGGCGRLAARYGRMGDKRGAAIAVLLAWAALVGAAANACQKIILWFELHGHTGQPLPTLAAGCAVTTFVLGGTAALFGIGGAIRTRSLRRRFAQTAGGPIGAASEPALHRPTDQV